MKPIKVIIVSHASPALKGKIGQAVSRGFGNMYEVNLDNGGTCSINGKGLVMYDKLLKQAGGKHDAVIAWAKNRGIQSGPRNYPRKKDTMAKKRALKALEKSQQHQQP